MDPAVRRKSIVALSVAIVIAVVGHALFLSPLLFGSGWFGLGSGQSLFDHETVSALSYKKLTITLPNLESQLTENPQAPTQLTNQLQDDPSPVSPLITTNTNKQYEPPLPTNTTNQLVAQTSNQASNHLMVAINSPADDGFTQHNPRSITLDTSDAPVAIRPYPIYLYDFRQQIYAFVQQELQQELRQELQGELIESCRHPFTHTMNEQCRSDLFARKSFGMGEEKLNPIFTALFQPEEAAVDDIVLARWASRKGIALFEVQF